MNASRIWQGGLLLVLTLLGSTLLVAVASPPTAPSYGMTVTTLPGTKRVGGIRFVVRVMDLTSKAVVAGSDLTVGAGETATARSEGPPDGPRVLMNATLSKDRKTGRYEVAIQEKGVVSSRVEGEVRLPLR